MEKIINGLKQIKNRIDSGTITTVNGTEHLLSKQLEELLKTAINYSLCCKSDSEQLVCEKCNGTGGYSYVDKIGFNYKTCECQTN